MTEIMLKAALNPNQPTNCDTALLFLHDENIVSCSHLCPLQFTVM